ncbi:Tautomerase/MIF [Durotheca rogersii]|uniref:Tautomerase/MIF n=1 Tax=Durotheca rogersii TaxID=419775 RepID=UPI002220BE21|nr:Tautomerase/MIF [Durotheca rogersii]KAI5867960.1 Tautomerase/MIF [Durotheca rogersii]
MGRAELPLPRINGAISTGNTATTTAKNNNNNLSLPTLVSSSSSASSLSSSSFPPATAHRKLRSARGPPPSPPPPPSRPHRPHLVEGNAMMRDIDRPPPGDPLPAATTTTAAGSGRRKKPPVHPDLARKRSAYFETEFAAANREPDPARTRVQNEAIVVADLRTNVITGPSRGRAARAQIKDEFSFITDLSYQLSNRYQRPMSSVAVELSHGRCLLFGGTFDPAYTLTIRALPALVQPATNRRNAALLQRHVHDALGVPPARGYLRFVPTPEHAVAVGGTTVAAQIDAAAAGPPDPPLPAAAAAAKAARKATRKLSIKSLTGFRSASMLDLARGATTTTPPHSASDGSAGAPIATIPEVPPTPPADSDADERERGDRLGDLAAPPPEKAPASPPPPKTAPRRRSLRFGLFGGRATPGPEERRRAGRER